MKSSARWLISVAIFLLMGTLSCGEEIYLFDACAQTFYSCGQVVSCAREWPEYEDDCAECVTAFDGSRCLSDGPDALPESYNASAGPTTPSNNGGNSGLPASCTDGDALQACVDSFDNPFDGPVKLDDWLNCGAARAAECACAESDRKNYCDVLQLYLEGQGRGSEYSLCTPCN